MISAHALAYYRSIGIPGETISAAFGADVPKDKQAVAIAAVRSAVVNAKCLTEAKAHLEYIERRYTTDQIGKFNEFAAMFTC